MNDLVGVPLTADGFFSACTPYIDKFNAYAGESGVPPIMLASFAMQESGCNRTARGQSMEVGIMQIAPDNCKVPYEE